MVLGGLGLAQALALFGGAGAIAVVLYLLRLRRRSVPVPFLALWEELLGEPSATRLGTRLRHFVSLLVALVVIALLAAALTDPRPGAASPSVRHTLLLVDAGLTMQATDVAPSRLDAARALARRIAADAGPSHRILVAALDATPLPLGPFATEPEVLEAAIERIGASDRVTRAEPGYRFALQVLRGRPHPEVVVVSDRVAEPEGALAEAFAGAGIAVTIERVGVRDANFALTELALRRHPLDKRTSELLLAVRNAGRAAGRVEVTLLGDGAPIAVDTLDVEPGETTRRFYDDVSGVERTLEARLRPLGGAEDHLPADDVAHAVVPERERARVLCVSEGNRYLEAALLLDEYLDVDLVAPSAYASADGYDAVIFDRFVPPAPPDAAAIYLRPDSRTGGASPLEARGDLEAPRFERVVRDHPLVRWIALRDVNVARAIVLLAGPGDTVVAADPRAPLLVAGERAGERFVALAFDVRESDLPLRTAWPLLLLDAIDWLREDDTAFVPAHAVGEPIRVTLPPGVASAEVTGPDGKAEDVPVHADEVVTSTARAGFVRVVAGGEQRVVAVQRSDEATGEITPDARDVGARAARSGAPRRADFEPWTLLLLAALALLGGEWLTYHRRWTV